MANSNFPFEVELLFSFLVEQHGFVCHGSRHQGSGRDECVVVRYIRDDVRMDIGWNPSELAIGILVCFENRKLGENDRYVHLEPFLLYLTKGDTCPIVPQIHPRMSISRIEFTADARERLFNRGYHQVLKQLAMRLRDNMSRVISSTDEQILSYQEWHKRAF